MERNRQEAIRAGAITPRHARVYVRETENLQHAISELAKEAGYCRAELEDQRKRVRKLEGELGEARRETAKAEEEALRWKKQAERLEARLN
jgi:chromosome segregation ATPase